MGQRDGVARGLVGAGVVLLLGGAATHWLLAYPRLPAALGASGLKAPLPAALEAVFLLAGWDWVVLAAVALLAISRKSAVRKPLLLLCGVAVVAEAGLMLGFLGWFLGTDIIAAAGALLLAGGVVAEGYAGAAAGSAAD